MTTTATSHAAARTPALARDVAMALAATEYERYRDVLRGLSTEDWDKPTDCPAWDVRAMACHMLGMAEMAASMRQAVHQMRAAGKRGGVFIDALTGVQVCGRGGAADVRRHFAARAG